MNKIMIQFQDTSGWRTGSTLPSTESRQRILIEMQQLQRIYKDARIRAVDGDGRLIDML